MIWISMGVCPHHRKGSKQRRRQGAGLGKGALWTEQMSPQLSSEENGQRQGDLSTPV